LQVQLDKANIDIDQLEKDNADLQTQVGNLRMAKDELVIENNDLTELIDADNSKLKKVLGKVVYLLTTGGLGDMIDSKELGDLIGLSSNDISALKRNGQKIIAREKQSG
jgi:FtsZ-binding cell division protein ZapB